MAHFISNQHTNKGLDPNIYVIDGIYNIKGRSTLYILVVNYTNSHDTFNKGQYIGHMEPPIDHVPQTPVNSIITQKMIDEHVQPDAFTPPIHTLLGNAHEDETGIGTTHLTKMQIDIDDSEPVS